MKKNFFEYTTNKNEILNKKSSIVNFPKKLFKYNEDDPAEAEAPKRDSLLQNLNEVLIHSQNRLSDTQKNESKTLNFILYLMLIFFLMSSGFYGPLFLLITSSDKLVKVFWRQLMTTFLLIPVAFCEKRIEIKHDFNRYKLIKVVMAGLIHGVWMMLYGYSLNFTSMTHVYILNNMDILFINGYKIVTHNKISRLEIAGMTMIVISIILLGIDRDINFLSEAHLNYNNLSATESFFKGDCIAFIAGIMFVIYLTIVDTYELNSPFWLCGMLISLFSACFQMIICWIFGASWNIDENTGIFGLFTNQWFFIHIIIAIIAGVFYFMFMGIIKKNFEGYTYRFIINLTPISAAVVTFFLGLENLPCVLVWICVFLMIVAGWLIVSGKKKSEGLEFELNKDEIDEDMINSNPYSRDIEMRINENNKNNN